MGWGWHSPFDHSLCLFNKETKFAPFPAFSLTFINTHTHIQTRKRSYPFNSLLKGKPHLTPAVPGPHLQRRTHANRKKHTCGFHAMFRKASKREWVPAHALNVVADFHFYLISGSLGGAARSGDSWRRQETPTFVVSKWRCCLNTHAVVPGCKRGTLTSFCFRLPLLASPSPSFWVIMSAQATYYYSLSPFST